jgi:hypothetical protein
MYVAQEYLPSDSELSDSAQFEYSHIHKFKRRNLADNCLQITM